MYEARNAGEAKKEKVHKGGGKEETIEEGTTIVSGAWRG